MKTLKPFTQFKTYKKKITFSAANAKTKALAELLECPKAHIVQFNLPCGWTCPKAHLCKGKYNPATQVTTWHKDCIYKCYAIKAEYMRPAVAPSRWSNYNLVRECKTANAIAQILLESLPMRLRVVRIHESGDFFSREYFEAWRIVAQSRPDVVFFAYTKVADYVGQHGDNLSIHYSHGGLDDTKAQELNLPTCYVVTSKEQADSLGIPLACVDNDYDDFVYIRQGKSFALLVH